MPVHATTVSDYCAILVKSKLIPEADVQGLVNKWKAESKGTDADLDRFRRYLVRKSFLTDYQAMLAQRGHTDGFFIGGYVILDRIGKGASAGVYKAVHTSGQVVALKVMPSSRSRDPNVLTRFQREGRLLTQLDHPNVVRAFQVGQAGNLHYIVMEQIDGETLDEVLVRRKKIPSAEAVRLIHQALHGLQHLHDMRMVHRDLKPSNLMISPPVTEGQPDNTLKATLKILDIGIGRELFDEESPETQDLQLTSEGAILGTPDYLAPEQARDARTSDIRADIYSTGCVLFHLINGRPPFIEKNVMALMVKHATEKIQPLAGVHPGLQTVFEKLTAKKPGERYETPAMAAEALRPYLPSDGATAMAPAVLPEYKQWLETESSMDLPAELAKKPSGGSGPSPALPAKLPPSAGTAPMPALPPKPPQATATAPAAKATPASTKMKPIAAAAPPVDDGMIDVELVTLPVAPPPMMVASSRRTTDEVERPLTDLNRRDYLMLGIGGFMIAAAGGLGVGLAKLIGGKAPPPSNPETEVKDDKK